MEKDAQYVASTGTPLGDRKYMAYMSTFVTAGRGEGIVTDTGMQTEIGRIAKMIHETPEEITPLQKRLGEDYQKWIFRFEEAENEKSAMREEWIYQQAFRDCFYLLRWMGVIRQE